MAKTVKSTATTIKTKWTPDDIQKAFAEIDKHEKNQAEYGGFAARAAKTAQERFGLLPKAWAMTKTLRKQEPDIRAAIMRQSLMLWEACGFFDQVDMFDDLIAFLEQLLDRLKKQKNNRPKTEELDDLAGED